MSKTRTPTHIGDLLRAHDAAQVCIVKLKAERDSAVVQISDLARRMGDDIATLRAERDRLKAALAESECLIEAIPAALAACEQRTRREEREACARKQLEKEAHMDCYQYGTVPAEQPKE